WNMTRSQVYQELKRLTDAALVDQTDDGRYRLTDRGRDSVRAWFRAFALAEPKDDQIRSAITLTVIARCRVRRCSEASRSCVSASSGPTTFSTASATHRRPHAHDGGRADDARARAVGLRRHARRRTVDATQPAVVSGVGSGVGRHDVRARRRVERR